MRVPPPPLLLFSSNPNSDESTDLCISGRCLRCCVVRQERAAGLGEKQAFTQVEDGEHPWRSWLAIQDKIGCSLESCRSCCLAAGGLILMTMALGQHAFFLNGVSVVCALNLAGRDIERGPKMTTTTTMTMTLTTTITMTIYNSAAYLPSLVSQAALDWHQYSSSSSSSSAKPCDGCHRAAATQSGASASPSSPCSLLSPMGKYFAATFPF